MKSRIAAITGLRLLPGDEMAGIGDGDDAQIVDQVVRGRSSWTGSSALSPSAQITSVGIVEVREGQPGPGRRRRLLAGLRHDDLARPVPVQHRGQRARRATSRSR